ncbi:MAG: ExbD/TolR family protein [Akkermansiaceae bacterium]
MPLGDDKFQIDQSDPEPDLSPMIDCVFILLIFFIVTATFVEEDGFNINKPEDSQENQANDSQTLVFLITKGNKIEVDGKPVSIQSVPALVQAQLQREERSPIIIQAHGQSRHGLSIEVQNACISGGAKPEKITLTDA